MFGRVSSRDHLRLLVNYTISDVVSRYREGTSRISEGSVDPVAPLASNLLMLSKEAIE